MYYRSGSAGAATAYQTGYTKRAVVYGAVAVGMIYFYSRGAAREKCLEGSFAYGRTCRACSDWECPVGQFRTTCTPHSDSYCKRCSNAPMDANTYAYTTPGNDNDCQYAVVKTSSDAEIFDELCRSRSKHFGAREPHLNAIAASASRQPRPRRVYSDATTRCGQGRQVCGCRNRDFDHRGQGEAW